MTDIASRAAKLITPALVYHTDIVVKKAHGLYVEAEDGREYMDFASGLATTNLGHCPPTVMEAARRQMEVLLHTGCIFRYPSVVELAERLLEKTPDSIEMFFFSNSGAEAIEGAIKLARHHTGRQGVIAFIGGFHGRTMGALSLTTSSARYRERYLPLLPSVFHTPYPYCYRCPMGEAGRNGPDKCSTDCFEFLLHMLKNVISPEEVACVVIEPVLGEGGYVVPPAKFLKKLRKLCTDNGILFIADEIQSGMGRTGRWFAVEHTGISPDIMTMAKAIASGFPLSVVASSEEIMGSWPPGAHGTTFGGNPVSCAAACATIDTIESQRLVENARKVGEYALDRLAKMQLKHPAIGDVRGLGLMIGIEIVGEDASPAPGLLKEVIGACMRAGLILIECGTEKNVARFMPPLITTRGEMARALDIFEDALASVIAR